MLRSIPMAEPKTGNTIFIEVDERTLSKICQEVRQDPVAMNALGQGYQDTLAALRRGDVSSPKPPLDYIVIYKIMNRYDERYAGALGSRIVSYLMDELIGRPDMNPGTEESP